MRVGQSVQLLFKTASGRVCVNVATSGAADLCVGAFIVSASHGDISMVRLCNDYVTLRFVAARCGLANHRT